MYLEQKVILNDNNRCIFLLNSDNYSFYIVIPKNQKMALGISIFDSLTEEIIKSIPIIPDKAIIIPVINSDVLDKIKLYNVNYYQYLDKLLSVIINTSYNFIYNIQEIPYRLHPIYQHI